MIKHLDELEDLNLPKDQYVIFGSGPLAVRGLRVNHDLDILVTDKIWDLLLQKNKVTRRKGRPDSIYLGNLQFLNINYKDWKPQIKNNMIMIKDSEIINNFPFVKLKYLLHCKKKMEGEKHKKDLEIIKTLLNIKN